YNQCSKPLKSSTDEYKEDSNKSSDNDKKNVSTPHSPHSENDSLQPSNNVTPPQPPPFHSQGPQVPPWTVPESTKNICPPPLTSSPIPEITPSQATLTLNPPQQQKFPIDRLPTKNNISNEPTPLEKHHEKIRFE